MDYFFIGLIAIYLIIVISAGYTNAKKIPSDKELLDLLVQQGEFTKKEVKQYYAKIR